MQFNLTSLLLLPFALLPLFLSFTLLDASDAQRVLLYLFIPAAIYAVVFSLFFHARYRKPSAVFQCAGIGAIAGFVFFAFAIAPWFLRGYFTDPTRVHEIVGAMTLFLVSGTVYGASCGGVVGLIISSRTQHR